MRLFKPRFERAPVNPEFIRHIKQLETVDASEGSMISRYGYIPHPVSLSHLKGKKLFIRARTEGLPSSYDLRKQGRVSSVQDQGPAGTCWTFATYGSLESCLLPEENWNFSENNMKNLLAEECPEGYDRPFDGGGNSWMSTAYLARWSGPVSEADDPYDPISGNCDEFKVRKHLKQVVYIPDRTDPLDNTNIKLAIKNSGAVSTIMGFDESYYNDKTASYYSTGGFPNHAVCLVGWDDNYNQSKFKTTPPGKRVYSEKLMGERMGR
nr:C1 family peptidase [Syntrophomonas palmitatica]